jgi:hypothetical protein
MSDARWCHCSPVFEALAGRLAVFRFDALAL